MRHIVAQGTFYDCGRAIGAAMVGEAADVLSLTLRDLLGHPGGRGHEGLRAAAMRQAKDGGDAFPGVYEYLAGLSDGTGLAFEDIAILAFIEEISAERGREKCSTLSVPSARGWLIGHNEDYGPEHYGRTFVVDLRVDGLPRVFMHGYLGQPGCTLNERGVAIANNSLWPEPIAGPSQNVRHFQAAFASDMDEALNLLAGRANGYTTHYTVAWGQHGELASLEVSNRKTASPEMALVDPGGQPICHTNHVLYLGLKRPDPALADPTYTTSQRLAKLKDLIARRQEPRTPEKMLDLLSANDGVLHRTPAQNATSVTLATIVMRPQTGEMWIRDADPSAADRDLYLSFRASPLN